MFWRKNRVRSDEPLLGLSNCIVLPHIAAMTFETQRAIAMTAARQCLAALAGEVPQNVVNPLALRHPKWTISHVTQLFSLAGRTAIITGASGAMGGAIAKGFAEAGAGLALTYKSNVSSVEALAKSLEPLGVQISVSQIDVQSEDALRAHAGMVQDRFGSTDILVNCAGGNIRTAMTDGDTGFFDLDAKAIGETFNLNVMGGAVLPCLAYGPSVAKSAFGGSIINVTSMNAYRPLEGRPAYAAAKAAVNNFTQWLACHVAQNYSKEMRVNAIAPGFCSQ